MTENKFDFLKKYNIQKKINALEKKYKNKKVLLYGANDFSEYIFENYNLSMLDIIGITDKIFQNNMPDSFKGFDCINPHNLKNERFDIILISDFESQNAYKILDEEILYGTKYAKTEIRPLISFTFKEIFLSKE